MYNNNIEGGKYKISSLGNDTKSMRGQLNINPKPINEAKLVFKKLVFNSTTKLY